LDNSDDGLNSADGGFSEHDETDWESAAGFETAAAEDANLEVGKWPRDDADDQKLGESIGGGVRAQPGGGSLAVLPPLPALLTDDSDAAWSCGSNDITISTWSGCPLASRPDAAPAPPQIGSDVRRGCAVESSALGDCGLESGCSDDAASEELLRTVRVHPAPRYV